MSSSEPSRDAEGLIWETFHRLADSGGDELRAALSDGAVQCLLTLGIKAYASKLEEEREVFPLVDEDSLTPTEVGVTVGYLIKAAEIDLFELVAWQSLMDQ